MWQVLEIIEATYLVLLLLFVALVVSPLSWLSQVGKRQEKRK